MLDIKQIREDPEAFRKGLARRDLGHLVDELLAADERRRELTKQVEELRAEQNRASKAIGRAEAETMTHLSIISRGFSRSTALQWAVRALAVRPLSGQAWRGLAAAVAPPAFLRMGRRLCGKDGAWERHCFTPSNRPESIL